MLKKDTYKLVEKENFFSCQADELIVYENIEDELNTEMERKFPTIMEQSIYDSLITKQYNVNYIYIAEKYFGQYNRMHDKKHIWGLLNTPTGIYQNDYVANNGKVYFGISQPFQNERLSYSGNVSLMLLTDNHCKIDNAQIFELFRQSCFEPNLQSEYYESLNKIVQQLRQSNPNILLLHFDLGKLRINGYGETKWLCDQLKNKLI